jgi:hypothetical protein
MSMDEAFGDSNLSDSRNSCLIEEIGRIRERIQAFKPGVVIKRKRTGTRYVNASVKRIRFSPIHVKTKATGVERG